MPCDFIPLHFFSWIKHGPALDSQHPLWIPDTGKPQLKPKADILESNDIASGNGKLSSYSRKAQRSELNSKREAELKVLDLTAGDDANTKLLKESIKNSSIIVSLLQGANDLDRKNADALVLNAAKMYELEPNTENKEDYLAALRKQKSLLLTRSLPQSSAVKEESGTDEKDARNFQLSDDDDFDAVGSHNLAISLTAERYQLSSPAFGDHPFSSSYASSSANSFS